MYRGCGIHFYFLITLIRRDVIANHKERKGAVAIVFYISNSQLKSTEINGFFLKRCTITLWIVIMRMIIASTGLKIGVRIVLKMKRVLRSV